MYSGGCCTLYEPSPDLCMCTVSRDAGMYRGGNVCIFLAAQPPRFFEKKSVSSRLNA